MQGNYFVVPFHVAGTLAANITFIWTAPFDCTLHHISATATNDSDATIIVGISTDTDSILASTTIGDSSTPVEKTRSNWATTNPTGRVNKGEKFTVTVDYDGSAGTAAQNLTVACTFTEG